jgi:hypothetical protein
VGEQTAVKLTNLEPTKQKGKVFKLGEAKSVAIKGEPANENKEKRYWALKLWLYGIIAISLLQVFNIESARYLNETVIYANTSSLAQLTQITMFTALTKVIFAVALLSFQKWGFWGLVMIGFFSLAVQIKLGVATVVTVMAILFGMAILCGLVRPGGKEDVWFKLR